MVTLQEQWQDVFKTCCQTKPTIKRSSIPLEQSPTGLLACVKITCPVCGREHQKPFFNYLTYDDAVKWNKEADNYPLWKVGDKLTFNLSTCRGFTLLKTFYVHSVRDEWYLGHCRTWYRLSTPKLDGSQRLRCDSKNEYTEADIIQKLHPL